MKWQSIAQYTNFFLFAELLFYISWLYICKQGLKVDWLSWQISNSLDRRFQTDVHLDFLISLAWCHFSQWLFWLTWVRRLLPSSSYMFWRGLVNFLPSACLQHSSVTQQFCWRDTSILERHKMHKHSHGKVLEGSEKSNWLAKRK